MAEEERDQRENSEFRIRRVDVEPTEENLTRLLQENPIGRNRGLRALIDLIHRIEGPYTLFLDGAWGTGKTIFAKQLDLVFKKLNQQLTSNDEARPFFEPLPEFEGLPDEGIVPVYYNAWENDYWPHPLPSLGAALADAAKEKFDPKSDSSSSKAIRGGLETIGNMVSTIIAGVPGAGTIASKMAEGLSGERILEAYRSEEALRDAVEALVEEAKKEQGNRVLLIIDELDRCKPSFALEMLEATKTLFDHPDVTVLYVLNEDALARMVEKEYGSGVTGREYLRKFYDRRILVSEAEAESYRAHLRGIETVAAFAEISVCLAWQFGMTLRDMNRWFVRLDRIAAEYRKVGGPARGVLSQMFLVVVPLLNAIEFMNPEDYKAIRDNCDGAKLWSYLQENGKLVGILHDICERAEGYSPEKMGEEFCKASCQVLWVHDLEEWIVAIAFLKSLQSAELKDLGSVRALLP